MNIEEVRNYALSLPHVTEDMPFGPDALALRIGGKIFCLMELSGHWQFYNVKVHPDYSLELRDRYACIRPGYHMNKRHWISIDLNSTIPLETEKSILRHAYHCTAKGLPRKIQTQLGLA